MKIRIFCGFIIMLTLSQSSEAQTINMQEFLDLVKQNHPFFTKEEMSIEIEKKEQERLLGAQDWVIRSSPFYFYQEPVIRDSFTPEELNGAGIEAAAERVYWNTGGRLSLSWLSDFSDQDLPVQNIVIPGSSSSTIISLGPSQFYQNKVFLTYSQPLLQNFGGKLDRLDYELSKYTVNFTEIQVRENQEVFLLDLGTRFLDWVLFSEQNRIANERLSLAEEELEQTEKKRAANLVDQVDVLRAGDAVRIAKQNIVLIDSQRKSKRAELAVLAKSKDIYNQSPKYDLHRLESLPAIDEAVSQLESQSRILHVLEIQQKQLSHLREGFTETIRPQLFFNTGVGLQSGNEEFADSLDLNQPDLSLSFEFHYPLGNRTAQAEVEKTELELQQLDKEIENVRLDLEAGVRNLLIQIRELEKVLTLNQDQIESAKAKTQEELRLYNQGRGDLTFVIQSRDNEENAKLTYAQNAASYHKLILQYRTLMDELLPSNLSE